MSNLGVCKASCCRVLSFVIETYMSDKLRDYYTKHGCKIERVGRNRWNIVVPCICPQLDPETNLCKLHGTDEKPKLCVEMNEKTMENGRYYCTEGCIYGK